MARLSREELEALVHSFGMSPMGSALDRMLTHAGTWLAPPEPERIGRKHSNPGAAYAALVKRGVAEADGNGMFRVVCERAHAADCGCKDCNDGGDPDDFTEPEYR